MIFSHTHSHYRDGVLRWSVSVSLMRHCRWAWPYCLNECCLLALQIGPIVIEIDYAPEGGDA